MISSKLIFMVLAIANFVVNMHANEYRLIEVGFREDQTKTEAFIHAFEYLYFTPTILNDNKKKGYNEKYQTELLEKFLETFGDYLQYIFEDPTTWFSKATKDYKETLTEKMIKDYKTNFGVTRISALTNAFYQIRYVRGKLPLIEFSNARNPSDYCSGKQLPPAFSIVLCPNGTLGFKLIEQSNQSPTPSHSVQEITFYNFLEQSSSSSGVGPNIDLNKPPPENEGN